MRLRPATADDLPAIHALNAVVEAHDRIPIRTPLEEFLEWTDEPHLSLADDVRLLEADGALVGWSRVWHRPSGEREERAYLFGGIHPQHRRRGLGSQLLRASFDRAAERLSATGNDLPRYVRATAYAFQHDALALYDAHGLAAVRWNDELLRPLDSPLEVPAPEGIAVVPWADARTEDARRVHNDAFADHWGYTPRDAVTWAHDIAAHGSRLDLSFLALEGDRVVGVCRNGHFPGDEAVTGRRDGWILQVGVLRSHRRRGIASALIAASLDAFVRAGFTHTALGVDSENPTGAYAIYERLGYRPMQRSVVHQRRI